MLPRIVFHVVVIHCTSKLSGPWQGSKHSSHSQELPRLSCSGLQLIVPSVTAFIWFFDLSLSRGGQRKSEPLYPACLQEVIMQPSHPSVFIGRLDLKNNDRRKLLRLLRTKPRKSTHIYLSKCVPGKDQQGMMPGALLSRWLRERSYSNSLISFREQNTPTNTYHYKQLYQCADWRPVCG